MNFFPDPELKEQLLQLFSDNVLKETAVRNFYAHFCGEYSKPQEGHAIFVQPKDKISEKQGVPVAARFCGIDLPVWIAGDSITCQVMIISQDPLRNEDSFMHPANPEKDCVLSTPWAAHLKFQLPKGEKTTQTMRKMRQLTTALTEKGVSLYLTDLYKTFFQMPDKRKSVLCWKKEDRERHREILKEEITLVNPDLIVVFGHQALGALHTMFVGDGHKDYIHIFKDLDKLVLHLVHPAAYEAQKRFFEHFSGCHGKAENHETAILNVLQAKGYTG